MKKLSDTCQKCSEYINFLSKVYIVSYYIASQYFNAIFCIDSTNSTTATDSLEHSEALIFGLSPSIEFTTWENLFYIILSLFKVDN